MGFAAAAERDDAATDRAARFISSPNNLWFNSRATECETALRLPILRIVREAYLTPLTGFGTVLASTWLYAVVTQLTALLPGNPSWLGVSFGLLVRNIAWCMTAAPVAVAWHRNVLLNERITIRSALRFNGRAIRFALLLLLLDVALSSIATALMWLLEQPVRDTIRAILGRKSYPFDMIAGLVILYIPMLLSTLLFARLVLVFPLCALDRRARSLREAWARSKGNTWRIFAVIAFTSAPFLLVYVPALAYMWIVMLESNFSVQEMSAPRPIGTLLAWLGHIPNMVLAVPVAACAASLVYRAIVSDSANVSAPAPASQAIG